MQTLSIVIPIYNEESILRESVSRLVEEVRAKGFGMDYEIILVENGSMDATLAVAKALAQQFKNIVVTSLPHPSYGSAIREGIRVASGDVIAIFNADFWDVEFLASAISKLAEYDFVLATKNVRDSQDKRALNRRMITRGFNAFLNVAFDYHGTDTHGIKVVSASAVRDLINQTVTNREILDTELVLRAQFKGLKILEIPVTVSERRMPRVSVLKRVPKTIGEIIVLLRAIGFRGSKLARELTATESDEKKFFYNSIANDFDRMMNRYDLTTRLSIVFDEFCPGQVLKGKTVLDAGCGTGWFTQRAVERGGKVFSLDVGLHLLSQVKRRAASHLVVGDLLSLPVQDKVIDIVVCSEAIEHTLRPEQAVAELCRIVRPGGLLILTVPNRRWHYAVTVANLLGLRRYQGYENWVNWQTLISWIEAEGMTVEVMRGFHVVPIFARVLKPILSAADKLRFLDRYMVNIAVKARREVATAL